MTKAKDETARDGGNGEFGVRWIEFDRHDRLVRKQRIFKTEAALDRFMATIEDKANFYAWDGFLGFN